METPLGIVAQDSIKYRPLRITNSCSISSLPQPAALPRPMPSAIFV
jgi:hypothetical protein